MLKKLRVLTLIGALCLSCSAFADRTEKEILAELKPIAMKYFYVNSFCERISMIDKSGKDGLNKCRSKISHDYIDEDQSHKLFNELKKIGKTEDDIYYKIIPDLVKSNLY